MALYTSRGPIFSPSGPFLAWVHNQHWNIRISTQFMWWQNLVYGENWSWAVFETTSVFNYHQSHHAKFCFFFSSISTFFSQFSFTGNRLWYSFILASFDLARIFGLPPSEGKVLIHLSQVESHQNTMFPLSKVFIYWVDYFFLIFLFFFYQTNKDSMHVCRLTIWVEEKKFYGLIY